MALASFLDPRLPSRFWDKVAPCPMSGCWLWTACANALGYGRFRVSGKTRDAHLVAHEVLVGVVPDGLELDHKCRTPTCCNPQHLEPVTHAENMRRGVGPPGLNARKTHCPNGHPYDTTVASGNRRCSVCHAAGELRRWRRRNGISSDAAAARNSAKTTCPNGHPYDMHRGGQRWCRVCRNEKQQARRRRATVSS